MTIDIEKFEAVLAKARGHILDELTPLLPHRRTEDWGAIFDAITAGMSVDLPALIAEHRAALARVKALEGQLSALQQPDGYWFADDREVGHFDLDEMLEDTPGDAIVAVVPWRELPIIFAASIITGEDTSEWRTFATEQAARAALEPKP